MSDCSASVDALYKAVQDFVEQGGGKVFVVGGIEVQEWPGDHEFCFRVAVKCTGRKPALPAAERPGG